MSSARIGIIRCAFVLNIPTQKFVTKNPFHSNIFKLADRMRSMRTNEILRTEIHGRFFWWWRRLSFFRTL